MNSPKEDTNIEKNIVKNKEGETEEQEIALNMDEQKIEEIREKNKLETEEEQKKKPSCKCSCAIF